MILIKGNKISFYGDDVMDSLHRDNGPAFIQGNFQVWYKEGKLHRIGGPAFIMYENFPIWYIEGIKYTEEEYLDKLKEMGL